MVTAAKGPPRPRMDEVGKAVVHVDEAPHPNPAVVDGGRVAGDWVPPTHRSHGPGAALVIAHLNQGFPRAVVPHPFLKVLMPRLIRRRVLVRVVGLPDPVPLVAVPRVLHPRRRCRRVPGRALALRGAAQVVGVRLPIRPGLLCRLRRGLLRLLGLLLRLELLLRLLQSLQVAQLELLRILSRPGR